MTALALYVIAVTVALVALSARLGEARRELDRALEELARTDRDRWTRAARDESAAFAEGAVASLAFLMACLAAWYAPPASRQARPAGAGRPGTGAGR